MQELAAITYKLTRLSDAAILNVYSYADRLGRTVGELVETLTLGELVAWEEKVAQDLRNHPRGARRL